MIKINDELEVINESGQRIGKVLGTGVTEDDEGYILLYRIRVSWEVLNTPLFAGTKKDDTLNTRAIRL